MSQSGFPQYQVRLVGADLYINSLFKPNHKKYEGKFNQYVRKRDAARSKAEEERYQQKVTEYYDKMYEAGYFRDSYNDSNLFWRLGLDYWVWFAGYLDEDRLLHPDKAQAVLSEVESRWHLLDEIEDEKEREYFRERYEEFVAFLRTAIGRGEPVYCSV